jgi:hypothetical protein
MILVLVGSEGLKLVRQGKYSGNIDENKENVDENRESSSRNKGTVVGQESTKDKQTNHLYLGLSLVGQAVTTCISISRLRSWCERPVMCGGIVRYQYWPSSYSMSQLGTEFSVN